MKDEELFQTDENVTCVRKTDWANSFFPKEILLFWQQVFTKR